jgi:tetraacyldisaccharide 4'-kinase
MNLKKPKFWDFKEPNLIAYLLLPLAVLLQYLNNFFKRNDPYKFKVKTVCVGNIYIGGTGKTSLSIQINKILNKKNIKTCFVKKFYIDQADEQKLLEKEGKLFLAKTRFEAIQKAEKENYEFAILDDGLQDPSIKYDFNLVCFNTLNWKGNGLTIPAGPLRESINNLKNYNHVFLNGNLENIDYLKNEIQKINSEIKIHLGKYEPINLQEFNKTEKYFVFSGIGNHKTFIQMLINYGLDIIENIEFPDHYNYKSNDIEKIISEAKKLNAKIITTEKDYLRLDKKYLDEIKFIKVELKIIDENKIIATIF